MISFREVPRATRKQAKRPREQSDTVPGVLGELANLISPQDIPFDLSLEGAASLGAQRGTLQNLTHKT